MSTTAHPPPGADAVETPDELRHGPPGLERSWAVQHGVIAWISAVNHKQIGTRFIVTALAFFVIGGIQALFMRVQLAAPLNDALGPDVFNELFTMHGTTMMFLFATPMVEGLAMYFAPLLLGARDMPFPRLNAFGYWCFLFGGVLLYSSFLFDEVPDGGWFMYVPLTGPEFTPGASVDFWLLGVTFVEIAAILAAIEIVVLVMRHRAAGMALHRMPLFVWAVFVTALAIIFAFPPLVVAGLLLELERAVGMPFYDPAAGGDPLLWQHLFWFFGHPEVYIVHLPVTGVVSLIVATFARRALVGYRFVVAALVAIAVLSFGVWVHHMFLVGLPLISSGFFAAASLAIAIPSGVQFFAWIATIWRGELVWGVPMLYVVGFLVLFLMGGITGVMFAVAPFDWQAHDTYFVVAHFHYVLIGGFLFPLFAALTYWWPKLTGRMAGERLGRLSFWLLFVGFNVTFLPMHVIGLDGMPRRVYTYLPEQGWGTINLIETIGAFVFALGVAIFLGNLIHAALRGAPAGPNPWRAGTLEWAAASPPAPYNFARAPVVRDREPLWHDAAAVAEGGPEELADAPDGRRQMLVTSILDGEPEGIVTIPIASLWPLVTAAAIAILLVGVLASVYLLALIGAVIAAVAIVVWGWRTERELSL